MNDIYKYFDKVYVITCPKFKKRHNYIKELFKKHNINKYEFIFGPYSEDLNLNKLKNLNIIHEKINSEKYRNPIATFFSHKLAWETMYKNKYQNCIFFEDDVKFLNNFENNFINFMENIPTYWSIIQFGWIGNKDLKDNWRHINKQVYLNWSSISGAHFYGLNRFSCNKLLKHCFPMKKAVDGFIGDITNQHTKKNNIILFSISPKKNFATDQSHSGMFESTFVYQ
jgi:GR25 family glycosyltransferase involved in LPS biosynthesis